MQLNRAVLRQRLSKRQRIQLDIGIPVRKALQEGGDDIVCALGALVLYFVAEIQDELPVF
jgi:hypothetical protein